MKILQVVSLLFLLAASSGVEARERGRGLRSEGSEFRELKPKAGSKSDSGGDNNEAGGLENRLDTGGGVIAFGNGSPYYGIDEPSDCIVFDSDLVQNAIETAAEDHDDICNANGCGSANSPGCCRFHFSLLRCDLDNDFAHQPCVCNPFTYRNPVPTATPTVSVVPSSAPSASPVPSASPAPSYFGENRVDEGTTAGNAILVPPFEDSCQAYNPDSVYYKEAHPYQAVADAEIYATCAAGDECPAGTCCTTGFCLCQPIEDENYCLPGYLLY